MAYKIAYIRRRFVGHLSLRRMHKRGKNFYHQSRVPTDLHQLLGKTWINHSLKVSRPSDAERINTRLTTQLADLYHALRKDPHTPSEAQAKLAQILGQKVPAPSLPVPVEEVPVTIPAKPDRRKVHKLSSLVDRYVAEKMKTWGPRSSKEIPSHFDRIVKALGDPDIAKMERVDLLAWVTKMESTLACNTVKGYATSLSTVLDYGRDVLGWITKNQAKNLPIEKDNRPKSTLRDPFTPHEAEALFADLQKRKADLYREGRHERDWVPLLMAFSGSRVNEICQLRVEDVYFDEVHPYFRIAVPEDGRKRKGKAKKDSPKDIRVKSPSSYRTLPIHRVLLTLGFGVYVKRIQETGQRMLFPSLRLGRNGYSHYFVTRYTANSSSRESYRWYQKVLGDACEKGNHSWRHTFIDMLKQGLLGQFLKDESYKNFLEKVIDEIAGHAVQGETWSRYGKKYYIENVVKVFNTHINYPFLPEFQHEEGVLYDGPAIDDEFAAAIDDEFGYDTGRVSSVYRFGEKEIKVEHGRLERLSPSPLEQLQRPDIHGYCELHDAIPHFFPEPPSSEFIFVSHPTAVTTS